MKAVALTTLFIAASAVAQPRATTPVEGYWKNPIGSAIIQIAPCGDTLCGKVVWASARGQREVAKNTSNVVGTTVLTNLKYARGHWAGSLYVPDDNIHVSAKLQLIGDGRMKLTGCGLMGLICRTQIWTRADGPLS
ncbi:MAG TPA: DUF2147 domain-containing protein [Sphingomicrobium sp.]|jgi:uncharacterized protein (DUF2147 family)|nr:DUF2147 domain-containing protein [Sphingomicrobium sp.]